MHGGGKVFSSRVQKRRRSDVEFSSLASVCCTHAHALDRSTNVLVSIRAPPLPCFVFSQIAKCWGEQCPLTLALVNAVAAAGGKGVSSPFSFDRYSWIERVLCDPGTTAERPRPAALAATTGTTPPACNDGGHGGCSGDGGDVGLRRVVELAFDTLLGDATKECFVRLGVLAEGTVAPSEMLSNLWDQVRG